MREILFRGKTESGKWIEGDLLQYLGYGKVHIVRHCLGAGGQEVNPETVGQYIGLTDKNGKKIFEGDIVKIYLLGDIEIGQITYSEMRCRFKFADKYGGTYGFYDICTFEVIGNIHDNPELLKGGASDA